MEIPRRGLAIYTFGNVSAFDARAGGVRDQAERRRLRQPHGRGHGRRRSRGQGGRGYAAALVRHADARGACTGRSTASAASSTRTRPTRPAWAQAGDADPRLRHDPRRPPGRGRPLHARHDRGGGRAGLRGRDRARRSSTASASADPRHTPMVLVAGHGPFTWGKTADKAVYHAVVLEELAKIAFVTRSHPAGSRAPARVPGPQALRTQARPARDVRPALIPRRAPCRRGFAQRRSRRCWELPRWRRVASLARPDDDHHLDDRGARATAHPAAADRRGAAGGAVSVRDPGDRPGAADVLGDRPPAGLTIAASSGIISGTTPAAGSYPVAVTATNSAGSATATYTILSNTLRPRRPWAGTATTRSAPASPSRRSSRGEGGEGVPAALRLEHRRHRLSLVRARPARRERPLPAVAVKVSVGDRHQRIQVAGRPDPRDGAQLRHPHHARHPAFQPDGESDDREFDVARRGSGEHQRRLSLGHAYVGRPRRHRRGAGLVRRPLRAVRVVGGRLHQDRRHAEQHTHVYHQAEADAIRKAIDKTGRAIVVSFSPGPDDPSWLPSSWPT